MQTTVRLVAALLLLMMTNNMAAGQKPWEHGRLEVSPNQRFLQHTDGTPFFWLGETAWLMPERLNREEVAYYLDKVRDAGYNMAQVQVLNDVPSMNVYGQPSHDRQGNLLTNTEYGYWDHMDYIITQAEQRGIYIGMVCIWGGVVKAGKLSVEQAKTYGTFLANRYKDRPNIIWIIGGDIQGDIKTEVWETLATTIKQTDLNHLMTYHPRGRYTSARWWSKAAWIDFHTFQSGHRKYGQRMNDKTYPIPDNTEEDNWMYVDSTWAYQPMKPVIDDEPIYEGIPKGLHDPNEGIWLASDVRRYAYQSVFAGSCGHTYGHNAIMQFYKPSYAPAYFNKKTWTEALDDPGFHQMQYLKRLMLALPYFERVPDQSIILDNGTQYDRLIATRGNDYLLVYNYTSRDMKVDLRKISGEQKKIWWMNASTGQLTYLGQYDNKAILFRPHKTTTGIEDGVLIAIDASKDYLSASANDHLPYLAEGVIDTTRHETLGLQKREAIQAVTIFKASDDTDHYANGVVMTAFKGTLYCMWQSSPKDEDSDDTWVAYSWSIDDGLTWSKPQPLAKPTDDYYCTSGGWLVRGDTLTAFIDTWQKGLSPRGGRTCYITSTDGQNWSPMQPVWMADGSEMNGVLEQDPYTLPDGRIVGAAHFMPGLHICPVYTDDPTGHSGWQRADFDGEDMGKQSREIEPSQYIQPDGTIVMLFRDQNSSFRKLASVSKDRGETWSKPQLTNIPDARTKQCAGNLPDGTAYMVCCPSNSKQRWPLVLLLSRDGSCFDKAVLLRSGHADELPPRRYEGKYKTLGYSYPKAMVHNGKLYITYSTNKEDVECISLMVQQSSVNPIRETSPTFFQTTEARRIGDQILLYQRVTGGWPKNIDMARPLSDKEREVVLTDKQKLDDSTIDNGATYTQMIFLARLYQQTKDQRYREAFRKGVGYLLSGQYANGGWPQFWPKKRDYQIHITYNDDAMVNTMTLLRDMVAQKEPYQGDLTDKRMRQDMQTAFDKGVECILATQIVTNGELTVWCQQHDRETLLPVPARAYELPSYCSQESAAITRLLMELPDPDERVKRAVHAAMRWFDKYKLTGYRYVRQGEKGSPLQDRRLEKDSTAGPLWSRYYDLELCEPYVCDRDGVPRRHLEQIGSERRNGYGWYGERPASLYPIYDAWADKFDPAHKVAISLSTKGANENGTIEWFRKPAKNTALFDAIVNPGDSIQLAIEQAPAIPAKPYTILIRKGTYRQKVIIDRPNIVLVGEDRDSTILILAETAKTRQITEYHGKEVGNGVIVLLEGADDCIISGLTVYNNYGTTVEPGNTTHQMAIFGRGTRTIVINCNVWADGNDALSLWAHDGGMYYHADLDLRCLGVDFLCPRGWCYATRCRFLGDGHAIIWHDGRGDKTKKLVIKDSWFDAKRPTVLGRYHHDSQFFLLNCKMTSQILDQNISYAYTDKVLDPCPWGQRTYYHNCYREGGNSGWLNNNLSQSEEHPEFHEVTAQWTFDRRWDPERAIRNLWNVLAY